MYGSHSIPLTKIMSIGLSVWNFTNVGNEDPPKPTIAVFFRISVISSLVSLAISSSLLICKLGSSVFKWSFLILMKSVNLPFLW